MKHVVLCREPEKHKCFPDGCPTCKPRAEFAFWWDVVDQPCFTIKGGSHDGSTVCIETLNKLGIEVPEYPQKG